MILVKTIVLTYSGKFGKGAASEICCLEDVEQIIADSGVSDHIVKKLKGMGTGITIV